MAISRGVLENIHLCVTQTVVGCLIGFNRDFKHGGLKGAYGVCKTFKWVALIVRSHDFIHIYINYNIITFAHTATATHWNVLRRPPSSTIAA